MSTKGTVFKSRFTPGLRTAEDVSLSIDDVITYELQDGSTVGGKIKSAYAQHDNGAYGWEVQFDDTGELGFADERRVIAWDGKTPAIAGPDG